MALLPFASAASKPGGSDTQLQYNNGGSFGGANLYWDDSNNYLGIDQEGTISEKLEVNYGHLRMNLEEPPGSPQAAVNPAAGNLNGNYWYRITFITVDGETGYGAGSSVVTPSNEQVDLTDIDTGSSRVTGRRIYRGNNLQEMYLVDTINDNTTTTYTDNVADGDLGALFPITNTTGGLIYNNSAIVAEASPNTTRFGYNAGGILINGRDNTLFGRNAGADLTSATFCTLVGSDAGLNITSGSSNVMIGYDTGTLVTTGTTNVLIGKEAGRAAGNISLTVMVGDQAGENAAANSSVIIGPSAGSNAAGANVIIGRNAGKNLSIANVVLGFEAGKSVTGSGNLILGWQAAESQTAISQQLWIDYNDNANPLIYGEFDNDIVQVRGGLKIGVGAADIDYTLTFVGETNSGVVTWMEDEDYFQFEDDVLFNGTNIGFFGTTPTTQPTEITDELTTITHTAPGTPDYAVQDLVDSGAGSAFGFATKDEGNTVLSVIANLQARVNELENALSSLGLLADAD